MAACRKDILIELKDTLKKERSGALKSIKKGADENEIYNHFSDNFEPFCADGHGTDPRCASPCRGSVKGR
jgi:hypothetical protein